MKPHLNYSLVGSALMKAAMTLIFYVSKRCLIYQVEGYAIKVGNGLIFNIIFVDTSLKKKKKKFSYQKM